jgi:hypothetical protein
MRWQAKDNQPPDWVVGSGPHETAEAFAARCAAEDAAAHMEVCIVQTRQGGFRQGRRIAASYVGSNGNVADCKLAKRMSRREALALAASVDGVVGTWHGDQVQFEPKMGW